MRTAIVSDLHLGSGFGEDLLRDAGIRRVLIDELAGADRLVLLGDVVELRELPLPTAMESARPFFEELGEAMAGKPVVVVPAPLPPPPPPRPRTAPPPPARPAPGPAPPRRGAARARTPRAGGRRGRKPDRRLAGRRFAGALLPGDLAVRGRLGQP